ncbi:MAG: sialate O-acetylesterase [Armatimonadota bacterium]
MRRHCLVVLLLLVAVLAVSAALADVKLPSLVGDNMCLQQGKALNIWGWADPLEKVTVSFCGQSVSADADSAGKWAAKLQPLKAGGPFEMTIAGKNSITLKNIVIGEVWVCSGQSNMQFGVAGVNNAAQEIAAANYPNLRLFQVPNVPAQQPVDNVKSQWNPCTSQSVPGFTAVGYFFGRDLHKALGIPIGLINTSWGGTPAEAWATSPSMKADPEYKPLLENWDKNVAAYPAAIEQYNTVTLDKWKKDCEAAKAAGKPLPNRPYAPQGPDSPNRPANLYNGMIAPLVNYSVAGAIWYQGESNAGRAYQYRKLLPLMIGDWRKAWGDDFPFYIVQLANFMGRKWEPAESAWAELREAQSMTAAQPKNGQAVIIDVGDAADIHPKDKQTVGYRLSLIGLANVYGQNVEYSGPAYAGLTIAKKKVRLSFTHAAGMAPKGGKFLTGFQIAGADKKWFMASAHVKGDTVVVYSRKVAAPVAVRYGWGDNPRCNLYNAAGLPASPFRTDEWPGVTINNH